jgi:hypothetical protein
VGVKLLCPCIIYWYSKTRVVEIWSIFFFISTKYQQKHI